MKREAEADANQGGGAGQGSASGNDEVTDVDFEEVSDEKK
jgi:hypothetical protein